MPAELGLPGLGGTETLEGAVLRVVFQNEESAFTVLELEVEGRLEPVTCAGKLLGVKTGEGLRVTGRFERHPRFGPRLMVASYVPLLPSTLRGIEKYLGSGLVEGIGPAMAERLVQHFGAKTLEILERQGERLTEVEGIGKVRAKRLTEAWSAQRDIKEVMIFLQGQGISSSHATKIWKRYGRGAITAVRENPYRLAVEVSGIGFLTADRVARELGIDRRAPQRAEAGVLHVLGEAAEEGHVFLPRAELVVRAEKLLELEGALIAGAIDRVVVAQLAVEAPGEAIYLRRLFEAEVGAAGGLRQLFAAPAPTPADPAALVARFEAEAQLALAPEQREAIQKSLSARLLVITGGPGTGKTTIVNGIIRVLEAQGRRVALAAPTGRAAKRMSEATGREAKTLHRLLEFAPKDGGFLRDESNPLECQVLIVDEVSMLDTLLLENLVRALPRQGQLVLVGDIDQLPSVGPGSVLADVIASGRAEVVRLTKIFRQAEASLIVVNAHRINRGELPVLPPPGDTGADFYFFERDTPEAVLGTLKALVETRIPRAFGLDPVRDLQVLTPMHKGSLGAASLNAELQGVLNPEGAQLERGSQVFRIGDKVMQIRNNYDLGVFNGDIGRISAVDPEQRRLEVTFDERPVRYEAAALEELTLAYACSVHKSQGSEYPAILLPLSTQHYMMLARNLLYTAVTRGKRLVVIVGSAKALAMAVRNHVGAVRHSGLAARLRAE